MKLKELWSAINRAAESGRGVVRRTPVEHVRVPTSNGIVDCFLKLENLQLTGSFKFRGAYNRLLALDSTETKAGVIAASTGNHGAAVARAAQQVGTTACIVVPEGASPSKLDTIRRFGGEILVHGGDCVESESYARQLSVDQGIPFVSPYNDPLVIAGQGTLGLELENQAGPLDAVFVSLGGGGLASGVATAIKLGGAETQIVACSPEFSPVMYESLRAGHIVEWPSKETLSDGTAGGVEPGAITFDLCRTLIDRHVLVTEDEIRTEMTGFIADFHLLAEGAAAVALAGFRKVASEFTGKRVGIVVCGGNVGIETLRKCLCSK